MFGSQNFAGIQNPDASGRIRDASGTHPDASGTGTSSAGACIWAEYLLLTHAAPLSLRPLSATSRGASRDGRAAVETSASAMLPQAGPQAEALDAQLTRSGSTRVSLLGLNHSSLNLYPGRVCKLFLFSGQDLPNSVKCSSASCLFPLCEANFHFLLIEICSSILERVSQNVWKSTSSNYLL